MHELHFFVELFFFLTLKILETQPKEKKTILFELN